MLNGLIEFSLRQKVIVLGLVLLMAVAGIRSMNEIPINSLPDVTPEQVLVITKAGRYSPYDVEQMVSYPIETVMNGLPDVRQVRSISHFGLSAVTIEFEEGTDIYFARQMVSQRVQSIEGDLPEGVSSPQLGPISTAMGEIVQYVIHGEDHSLTELRTLQDWLIAPQLKNIRGVTEINSFGGFVRQIDVMVDPDRMQRFGVSLDEVMESLSGGNQVTGGNFLEINREQYIIRGYGQLNRLEDLERTVISHREGRPVYIRDVASVQEGRQLRQGAVTQDGRGEVVTGIVMMLRGGNSRVVIQDIQDRMAVVNQSLPEGVSIETFYDQSDLVNRTTRTITVNLVEGGLFVIAVLLLLLGEISGALIVASVIPLSMLFAFIGMEQFGLAANLMSLGAIDFGMVVDGSVVMMENIIHRLHQKGENTTQGKRLEIIRNAAREVGRPIFFGVLIIMVVYIPIMTFSGMEGILFRPMAITVATAVFGSLLLALLFVPAVSSLVFRRGVKVRKNYLIGWLRPRYQRFLAFSLEHKEWTIGVALAIFITSLILLPRLGTEFLPELEEGSILIEQIRMPSVTLEESVENADWLAGILSREIPEVETVVAKTGRSDLANDWMGVHQTDIWVVLHPVDQWREGWTKTDIIDTIRPYLEEEPGLSYNFTQPIAMRVDELTSGVKSDIAVKVFGEDLDVLSRVATDISTLLPELEGTDNVLLEQQRGQPYITVELDRERISAFGLMPAQVQRVIETGLGGSHVTDLFEGQRRFGIVVRFPEAIRNSLEDIRELPVALPGGGSIPLHRVASVRTEDGPREIAREDNWRRVIVGVNIRDIDIGTYVSNLQAAIENEIDIPAGTFLQYGGAFEDQQRAMSHLYLVVPLSLMLILGLLYIMFGKFRYTMLIFLNLPLALSGGIFILFFRDLYLSVSASIGFVALFGVAVLNGIVMVAHLNKLRERGLPLRQSVLEGATDRLRPVLMTALVASLGFIPMAFNTGPGSEVQRPLASVVIGGLVTATMLTLLVLPTVYHWMERREEARAAKKIEEETPTLDAGDA